MPTVASSSASPPSPGCFPGRSSSRWEERRAAGDPAAVEPDRELRVHAGGGPAPHRRSRPGGHRQPVPAGHASRPHRSHLPVQQPVHVPRRRPRALAAIANRSPIRCSWPRRALSGLVTASRRARACCCRPWRGCGRSPWSSPGRWPSRPARPPRGRLLPISCRGRDPPAQWRPEFVPVPAGRCAR